MQEFEKVSLEKKEVQKRKEEVEAAEQEYNDYGDEYGYYDNMQPGVNTAHNLLGTIQ